MANSDGSTGTEHSSERTYVESKDAKDTKDEQRHFTSADNTMTIVARLTPNNNYALVSE